MSQFQKRLIEIALDKLLFAAIVAALVAFLARSLERLKTSLAWDSELLKERLASAKALMNGLRGVQEAHQEAVFHAFYAAGPPRVSLEGINEAVGHLDVAIGEARLVLSEDTIKVVERARHSVYWFLEEMGGKAAPPDESVELNAEVAEGMSKEGGARIQRHRETVAREVKEAIEAIQKDARVHGVA